MTNRELTQKIKSVLLSYGADLVGIAPNERFKNAPYLISPKAILHPVQVSAKGMDIKF